MNEYLVHYEKHNQIIMWIRLWHCWLFKRKHFFTPTIWQHMNIILQCTYVYWTKILTFTAVLPRSWRTFLCSGGERDRDLWKGPYGFGNEEGWHFRSGIKMARKSCLINSPKHGHEKCARNRTGFTGHQEVVKPCRGTSVWKCCSLQGLEQLAVPWTAGPTSSKRYKHRSKPFLFIFFPFEYLLWGCRTHSKFPHYEYLKICSIKICSINAECPKTLKLFQTFSREKSGTPN